MNARRDPHAVALRPGRGRAAWRGLALASLVGCSDPIGETCSTEGCGDGATDAALPDAAMPDAATPDAATPDAALPDAAMPDARLDATADSTTDAMADGATDRPGDVPGELARDAAMDVPLAMDLPSLPDVSVDVAADVTAVDAPAVDVRPDTPAVDVAPTGGCVSGAAGTHAIRFRWTGSGPGSRASVTYELNTLPDRARWRVTAASRSIGYTPVYDDTFLGPGGLVLSGTVFMDVELSTAGLSSLSHVTLAVYGRSFNTTASGSFSWRTFSGTGDAPSGLVANSAPYAWYRADATAAFVAGDGAVLLRITPGPPSGSIIVNRVEVCFDAR